MLLHTFPAPYLGPVAYLIFLTWGWMNYWLPYPLEFLVVRWHVLGIVCIYLLCVHLLFMGCKSVGIDSGPRWVPRTMRPASVVNITSWFLGGWKYFPWYLEAPWGPCWSHAALWVCGIQTAVGGLSMFVVCSVYLVIVGSACTTEWMVIPYHICIFPLCCGSLKSGYPSHTHWLNDCEVLPIAYRYVRIPGMSWLPLLPHCRW